MSNPFVQKKQGELGPANTLPSFLKRFPLFCSPGHRSGAGISLGNKVRRYPVTFPVQGRLGSRADFPRFPHLDISIFAIIIIKNLNFNPVKL